ncbi:hypothetical protein HJC10_28385 [Corallococcus exiguus]|uniref:Uncharacterized protein n=1 Tax=Corallococcus exiguus TaxID=83462 RepID=A0A7Y1RQW1_9BACT|nr:MULTISPECIES: hypothetical protein [Corallococcus]NBC45192.1 hypothetical protein [Corallococcus exiguus]NNB88986.1 hypothetical protein [Corallococcus exiguus]NNB97813.1 hypothetical protein [Corallococcus exiguus]NNC06756.1 hypothetical protein [Corallococcus exiguus]NPC50499.1 hypothetical protein [Corallococcus exiguus]
MTASVPDVARLSPEALSEALRALEPRTAAVLVRRLVERRPQAECAAWYGISSDAFSVLLLRSAVALARQLGQPARSPESPEEATAWERMLAMAVEKDTAPVPVPLAPVAWLCRRMHALGPEVEAALDKAAQADADSPGRAREEWLRRLAVAALLALTAWLYWSRPPEPEPRPERRMRSPERR